MYLDYFNDETDEILVRLKQRTSVWFRNKKTKEHSELLHQYYVQCCSGFFKDDYAGVLSDSLECYTDMLGRLTNQLSPVIADALDVSRLKIRLIMSMMIYWLIQYHSGYKGDMPVKSDIIDIFNSVLDGRYFQMK